ncbi:MAG TPA: HNH endonuclease signature motif containing protein [Ignavibacteriales bacterium]|nr:HNH endonuclease signature motif containing protein [Ignavibacteriales bacterium]
MKTCKRCNNSYPATKEHFHSCKAQKDGLHPYCKKCRAEIGKPWRKKYYDGNKDEAKEANKIYYEENKAHINEKAKLNYYNNIDKAKLRMKAWRTENKDKVMANAKKWRVENKDKIREIWKRATRKRLNILKNINSELTQEQWEETLSYFSGKCAYCGNNSQIEKDHLIPITKGGQHVKSNVVPACKSCNSSKHNLEFDAWYFTQPVFSNTRFHKIILFLFK